MQYSIDTNALIDLVRRIYPPKIFPSLLRNCESLIAAGNLIATHEVLVELERKTGDEVHAWAISQPRLFLPTGEIIQAAALGVLELYPNLIDPDATEPQADPFVIALAKVRNCSVVSGEKANNKAGRPKIPNVCKALSIPCLTLLEFFEEQHWTF